MTKMEDTRDSFSNDSLEWKNPDMASADTLRKYLLRTPISSQDTKPAW